MRIMYKIEGYYSQVINAVMVYPCNFNNEVCLRCTAFDGKDSLNLYGLKEKPEQVIEDLTKNGFVIINVNRISWSGRNSDL